MKLIATSFVLTIADGLDDASETIWTRCAVVAAAAAKKRTGHVAGEFSDIMSRLGWNVQSDSSSFVSLYTLSDALWQSGSDALSALRGFIGHPVTGDMRALLDWWWEQTAGGAITVATVASSSAGLVADIRTVAFPHPSYSNLADSASLEASLTSTIFVENSQVYREIEAVLAEKAAKVADLVRVLQVSN